MYGYTEIIQVMGAMIIFSIILLSTNRYMLTNTHQQTTSEIQTLAISIAQDLIDEALLKPFDDSTIGGLVPYEIPEDFVSAPFPSTTAGSRDQIESFEGYNGWQETIETELGVFTLEADVHYVDSNTYSNETSENTRHKRIIVTVENPHLNNPVEIKFVRTYNHD